MPPVDRVTSRVRGLATLAVLFAWAVYPAPAEAQFGRFGLGGGPGDRFELSETVQLDRADSTVRTTLDRVDRYLADEQWEEAVGALATVMEESGTKLLGVTGHRFTSIRDYCHLRLASLPPEALAVYRSRVDPAARQWYEEGIRRHDRAPLVRVLDWAFASSWGDDALYALGEMALESGGCAAARSYWEKCIPVDPPADAPATWLAVPDTDLDLAAVRARLVLASILEGSLGRADEELAAMSRLHPDARGRFGGRQTNYVEALQSLLAEAAEWPDPPIDPDWPTFAGSPRRGKIAFDAIDPAEVAWRASLRPTIPASQWFWGAQTRARRVAEDAQSPLSYHPVVVGDLVLVNNQVEIAAFDLATGEPAWGSLDARLFRDPFDGEAATPFSPEANLGVPRFTMTAFEGRLYARMGSPVTARPRQPETARGAGYLVCIDLEAEGRLVWKIAPPEDHLAFEGSPVTNGADVFVAMRRSDVQPQAFVACYDASSGRLRWQQPVCAAETPARGMVHETTHNLLTLHRDTLYVNTNLGAVAALSARDGRLKWVSLYPRARKGDLTELAPHWCRDLNPCVYDRGTLLVAPTDSRRIFALEAATGQILWQTGSQVEDVVHLVGVAGDALVAGGDGLYWISLEPEEAGKVRHVWPLGHERLGYGRGVLAGDCVLWPTREKIYVFDQADAKLQKEISLVARGTTGGNLLVAPGYLLIAGSDRLVALRGAGTPRGEPERANDTIAGRVGHDSIVPGTNVGHVSNVPGANVGHVSNVPGALETCPTAVCGKLPLARSQIVDSPTP